MVWGRGWTLRPRETSKIGKFNKSNIDIYMSKNLWNNPNRGKFETTGDIYIIKIK